MFHLIKQNKYMFAEPNDLGQQPEPNALGQAYSSEPNGFGESNRKANQNHVYIHTYFSK